jgi:hypothetical protein
MDFGMADGAPEQRFVRNQPVLVIQQQQNKCLFSSIVSWSRNQSRTELLDVNDAPGSRNWRSSSQCLADGLLC